MSFAVIKTGGKQYKVKASEILKIEKLNKENSGKIEFNEVLAYGNDKTLELGAPIIKGAKVEAELIKNGKNRTILVFKKPQNALMLLVSKCDALELGFWHPKCINIRINPRIWGILG